MGFMGLWLLMASGAFQSGIDSLRTSVDTGQSHVKTFLVSLGLGGTVAGIIALVVVAGLGGGMIWKFRDIIAFLVVVIIVFFAIGAAGVAGPW